MKEWLAPIRQATGRVFPVSTAGGSLSDRLQALAERAGLGRWRKNGLRHSFISHRVAGVKNVEAVALESGNSPTIIFSNYRSLVTEAEATNYFAVVPSKAVVPDNVTRLSAAVA